MSAATATTEDRRVTVKSGGNRYKSEKLIGYRVSDVRDELDHMDIESDTVPNVNGNRVDDDYILAASDVLTFVRATGTKG